MPSPGKLRSVDLVRTDVSEESIASIIRMKIIGELHSLLLLLVTANVVPSSLIFFQSDDGGDTFLINIPSYKNHTA
jgi:hypothetical protein